MTDPVTLLRQAADKLGRLADASTSGPWVAEYSGETGDCVIPHDAQSTREYVCRTQLYHRTADAEWIATMHPGIAAPLAELLRHVADDSEYFATVAEHTTVTVNSDAINLARAILGHDQ